MNTKNFLFIPKKLRVGFQYRTFGQNNWSVNKEKATEQTKLGYIIYWDESGKLRKETSWNDWRDKELGDEVLDNDPIHGFSIHLVRNGYRGEWFSGRDSKILIKHPNGFVFEITPENACSLIIEGGVEQGTGVIGGEQVLAWDGKDLILLGTKSTEYIESLKHTKNVQKGINDKDLIPGHVYRCRNGSMRLYFGRIDYYTGSFDNFRWRGTPDDFDKWITTNPYFDKDSRYYYKLTHHNNEHTYTNLSERTNFSHPDLHTFKSCKGTLVEDLGEYEHWKDVLDYFLTKRRYHGESYSDPIVKFREVEMTKEEFSDHLRKYACSHLKNDSFSFFSKRRMEIITIELKKFIQDIDNLLLGNGVVPWRAFGLGRANSSCQITLDDIMRCEPIKIETVTKSGEVVEWSSWLQQKSFSYTIGSEDLAGKSLNINNEKTFPPFNHPS